MRALAAAALVVLAAAAPARAHEDVPQRSKVRAGEKTVSGRHVLADGHVDLGPRYAGGRWRIQLRDDAVVPSVWRNLSDVVLHARAGARVELPDDPAFAFLGRAGVQVWLLPQVQRDGVLWPGWNTQDPEVVQRVRREVTWRLLGVRGRGDFVLYLNGAFGAPETIFDSAKSFPQETGVDLDTYVHGNWVFSAPGTYALDIELRAATRDGGTVSARDTLRYFAGEGDPATAFPPRPAGAGGADGGAANPAALPVAVAAVLAAAALGLVLMRRRRVA